MQHLKHTVQSDLSVPHPLSCTETFTHTPFFFHPSICEMLQQMPDNYSAITLFFVTSATVHSQQQAVSAHWLWILTTSICKWQGVLKTRDYTYGGISQHGTVVLSLVISVEIIRSSPRVWLGRCYPFKSNSLLHWMLQKMTNIRALMENQNKGLTGGL